MIFFLNRIIFFFSIVQDGRTALHYSCANANAMRLGSMLASKGLDATVIGKKMFQTIYSLLDNAPRFQLPDLVRYPKEDGLSDRKKPKYLSVSSYR